MVYAYLLEAASFTWSMFASAFKIGGDDVAEFQNWALKFMQDHKIEAFLDKHPIIEEDELNQTDNELSSDDSCEEIEQPQKQQQRTSSNHELVAKRFWTALKEKDFDAIALSFGVHPIDFSNDVACSSSVHNHKDKVLEMMDYLCLEHVKETTMDYVRYTNFFLVRNIHL